MPYDFMHQKVVANVHQHGMIKEMLEDIKLIVFMNQILMFVKK